MSSGTNDAIRKFISEREDPAWQHAIFGNVVRTALVFALGVALLFVAAARSGLVESIFGPRYVPLFYLLAIFAIGRQGYDILLRTLIGLQLEAYSESIRVIRQTLFVSISLVVLYSGYEVRGLLFADILTSIVIIVISLYATSKFLDLKTILQRPNFDIPKRTIRRYILSTIVFFGLQMSLYHVDIIVIQHFYPERLVGYYKGALTIAETLWFIPVAMQLALLQRVSALWEEDEIGKIQTYASRTTRLSISFTLLIVVGIAALANTFVPLYLGTQYIRSIQPLLLLLPGVVGFAGARPTIAINQARRSLRPLIFASGASALVNLILNLIFVPHYGLVGAAISTSIGYSSLLLFQSLAAKSLGYSPFNDLRLPRILITMLTFSIPILILAHLLPPYIGLIIVPPVGLLIFMIAAISFEVVSMSELEPIISSLPPNLEVIVRKYMNIIPIIYES